MEKKYLSITREKLVSGELTPAEAVAQLYAAVELNAGYMNYLADIMLFAPEQIDVYAVSYYLAKVSEGGHEGFLFDAAGVLWREAIVGLDRIGAEEAAENLRSVRNKFPIELPFELAERISSVCENDLSFAEEDEVFGRLRGDIEELLKKYVADNAEAFEFEGEVEII